MPPIEMCITLNQNRSIVLMIEARASIFLLDGEAVTCAR